MGNYRPHQLHPVKWPWELYVVVGLAVTVVALAVALITVLCQPAADSAMAGNGSLGLVQLRKALDVTNLSLAETHRQWDGCRKQLGVLEGKAAELELALANITKLQEKNRVLQAELAQQQAQLGDLQSSRDELQLQNQRLEKQLRDMWSQYSSGNRIPAVSLSLLALLLPGMLIL